MAEEKSLALFNEADVQVVVSSAVVALRQNTSSANSALAAMKLFIANYKEEEYDAELDGMAGTLLKKVTATGEGMNHKRSSFTRFLSEMTTSFTTLENIIAPKKSPEFIQIQKIRDDFQLREKRKRQEAEDKIRLESQKAQEKITLKAELEIAIRNYFLDYVGQQQQALLNLFNGLTLENIVEQSKEIEHFEFIYPWSHFTAFKVQSRTNFILDKDDRLAVWNEVKAGKFESFQADFKKVIMEAKQVFMDKLNGKRIELQEIADAGVAQKKQLEEEAEQRRQKEQADLNAKQEQEKKDAADKAEKDKQIANVQIAFNTEVAKAELVPENTASVREGISITVLKTPGYMELAAFYFQKEGLAKTTEELEKKFGFCKTFAEKYLFKHPEEKLNSSNLKFEEVIKAVNRKA